MSRTWTSPEDIAAKVRRRWEDGSLLRDFASGAGFVPIEMSVRGPKPSAIGDDLDAVREWVGALVAGSRDGARYALEWAPVGGRAIGRNDLPHKARVTTYEQAWALLGVGSTVRRFQSLLEGMAPPAVRDWALSNPHRALTMEAELPQLVAAYTWLSAHRDSGRYLRQISAPGVDTKFAERHRAVLASMLGVPSSAAGFLSGLGLRGKPEFVRMRVAPGLGLPFREAALPVQEMAALALDVRTALVIENEITYLSVDVPDAGAVLWGKGFEVDRLGRLPWLARADVVYWGDIDTHGFAILDRLRAWLPQTRSVLMDRATLLAHRDRWVLEDRPAAAALTRLTAPELKLYADLVQDSFGKGVRLEQERIDWTWAATRLTQAMRPLPA